MDQQQYFEQLKQFGTVFLNGYGGDMQAATTGLQKVNELLAENPGVIKFVANPENQKVMGEAIEALGKKKGDIWGMIPTLTKLGKKLKFNQ